MMFSTQENNPDTFLGRGIAGPAVAAGPRTPPSGRNRQRPLPCGTGGSPVDEPEQGAARTHSHLAHTAAGFPSRDAEMPGGTPTASPSRSGPNGLIPHVPLDLRPAASDHRGKLGAVPGPAQ